MPIGRCGANDLQPPAAKVVAKIRLSAEILNFIVFPHEPRRATRGVRQEQDRSSVSFQLIDVDDISEAALESGNVWSFWSDDS